jgi:phosphoribulokinase
MDLEKSVIKMSSEIIEEFSNKETLDFYYLFKKMERRFGVEVNELFIPSLTLLYSLNKIEYIINEDLLRWL